MQCINKDDKQDSSFPIGLPKQINYKQIVTERVF